VIIISVISANNSGISGKHILPIYLIDLSIIIIRLLKRTLNDLQFKIVSIIYTGYSNSIYNLSIILRAAI